MPELHSASSCSRALQLKGQGETVLAADQLSRAAEGGDTAAARLLDEWKVEGIVPFSDDDEAILLLEAADKRGWDSATFQLAERIRIGRGVEADPKRAAALYTAAAKNGHAPSMLRLAELLERGEGVKSNPKKAAQWAAKAALRTVPISNESTVEGQL